MRFTVAWANVISENLALKLIIGFLTLVIFSVSGIAIKLSGRKPLIIERTCFSKAVATMSEERTQAEIEAFVREALSHRFDTVATPHPGFISAAEEKYRVQEQQEFKKREIKQRIIVNEVKIERQQAIVDCDRLFSMGAVRSVLPFPLTLSLGTTERSEANPYGLVVLQVTGANKPDGKPEEVK